MKTVNEKTSKCSNNNRLKELVKTWTTGQRTANANPLKVKTARNAGFIIFPH